MPVFARSVALATLLALATGSANADPLDALNGRYAFDWQLNPARTRCAKVEGRLLAELKSARFSCDLKFISNTASGVRAQVCKEVKGKREYLIFEALRGCEGERKVQASNG